MTDHDVYLNDIWAVFFHDPSDNNWTITSYQRIGDISNINDFWDHMINMRNYVHKGMFFIMREHIFPCWDDPGNINGGCISMKVLKEDMTNFWEEICMQLVGESLLKSEYRKHWDMVTGISTSPKKHFCIVKIWISDVTISDKLMYDVSKVYHGDMIYKSNQENISCDVNKL